MKTLTFSFDFISPYAYLAAEGIQALAQRNGCRVVWRPILLAALLNHNKQLGPAEIPDKRTYTFKHISRLAHDLDLPLQPPPGHPFNPLLPLRIACLRPEGELVLHLFRACWKDGFAIDTEDALKPLMDEDTLRRATTDEAKQRLKDNTQEAIDEGVFGVPSISVDSEVFWGLDSFHHLERYLAGQDPLNPELLLKWETLPASASRGMSDPGDGELTHPEPSWHGADPDEADFRATVHQRYRHLRTEAPVSLTPRGAWRLTRYADCTRLLKQTKVGVRTTEGKLPLADESKMPRLFMLEQDPPDHERLRKTVARYFTPRAMDKLHKRVQEITRELLADIGQGEFDLMKALALRLPTAVNCEMMGVPPEDRTTFTQWTDDMTYFLMGKEATDDQQRRSGAAIGHMMEYITARIEERRNADGDDLISVLVQAEDDERLSQMELLWQCMGLILAGFETTTGLIGNGVRQLLLHPGELARLRQDPSLIDSAVEECLRFDPPILATARFLHEEAEFGGFQLPVNARVTAILAAANRDPEEFEDPDRFDIGRTPNKHLGFGGGAHICLGAYLARLEAREAIGSLFQRFPNLQLVSDEQKWTGSLFRILEELPVKVGGSAV